MAAASILMPYLMSMLLGRTIDLKSYSIGPNIYDDENYVERPLKFMNATYHVIQDKSFPYENFGMPIDVVLRIKANYLSSSSGALGLDGLLKDTTWMHNSAVVAVTVLYNTVQRNLSEKANLLDGWNTRTPQSHTHYAASMVYGGWFAVLYRFKCDVPADVDSVRKTITKILGTSGTLEGNVTAKWLKVQEAVKANINVRGQVNIEVSTYSSVKLPIVIDSPKTLVQAMQLLPQVVGDVGSPMYMELRPLSTLDNSFPGVERVNSSLKDLILLDQMFDDVQSTRTNVVRWVRDSMTIFDDEEESMISDLLENLGECLRHFYDLVDGLSLYKEVDYPAFHRSFNIYIKGLGKTGGTYGLAYLRLKQDIDAYCDVTFLHGIKGLLSVYEDEFIKIGEVGAGGLEDCKKECLNEEWCKSIGYADKITEMDLATETYVDKMNQCWVYYRSTSTATVVTPNGVYGDIHVYDRDCV